MHTQESRDRGKLRLAHLREFNEATAETMDGERSRFDRLRDPNAAPVVVSSPQLFPTPKDLAARMAERLDATTLDCRVLEPSAGTGRLCLATWRTNWSAEITAIEINDEVYNALTRTLYCAGSPFTMKRGDFLQITPREIGDYERIIMNPPFKNGADMKHIQHALTFLAPGGRLVALCADGPRQNAALRPIATTWEQLPPGSFASEGTRVNTVLLTVQK